MKVQPSSAEPRRSYQDQQLLVAHQLHQAGHHAGPHHHLDAVVVPVRQVGDGPAGVSQDLPVSVVQQLDQGRQDLEGRTGSGQNQRSTKTWLHQAHLQDRRHRGTRVLVPTQVGQGPRQVTEVAHLEGSCCY